MAKVSRNARLDSKTVTKASKGKANVPKKGRTASTGSKSGKVDSTKVNPRVMSKAKELAKPYNGKVVVLNDGTVIVRNK